MSLLLLLPAAHAASLTALSNMGDFRSSNATDIAVCGNGTLFVVDGSHIWRATDAFNPTRNEVAFTLDFLPWFGTDATCVSSNGVEYLFTLVDGWVNLFSVRFVPVAYGGWAYLQNEGAWAAPYYVGDLKAMSTTELISLSIDGWGDRGYISGSSLSFSVLGNMWAAAELGTAQDSSGLNEVAFAANFDDYSHLWYNDPAGTGDLNLDTNWQSFTTPSTVVYKLATAVDLEAVYYGSNAYIFGLNRELGSYIYRAQYVP